MAEKFITQSTQTLEKTKATFLDIGIKVRVNKCLPKLCVKHETFPFEVFVHNVEKLKDESEASVACLFILLIPFMTGWLFKTVQKVLTPKKYRY